jgi:hypothetical protein
MRRAGAILVVALALAGCGSDERNAKPLSEPGERVYDLAGTILARDAADNTVQIQHGPISGFMEAMTMDFSVRGGSVGELPPDGAHVTARLHVTERAFWLTDIKQTPK